MTQSGWSKVRVWGTRRTRMKEPRMVTEVTWAAGEGLLIFSAGREQWAWV